MDKISIGKKFARPVKNSDYLRPNLQNVSEPVQKH